MNWTSEISQSDFEGELNLPQDNTLQNVFNESINRVVEDTLRKLLGNDLYAVFEASYDSGSPDQKWVDIWDGLSYEDIEGFTQVFKGMRKACLYFIYYDLKKRSYSETFGGSKRDEQNNTVAVDLFVENTYKYRIQNGGVNRYNEAKLYISTKSDKGSTDYSGWLFTPIEIINTINY